MSHKALELVDDAMLSVLPEDDRIHFTKIPSTYLSMNLPELTLVVQPTPTDKRIRVAFWLEYESAVQNHRKMKLHWVSHGMMNYPSFVQHYLKEPRRLAWLIQKPLNYQVAMEEALLHGLDRVREILDLPLINAKGMPDPRVASVILQAVSMIDQRVKGGPIQRVQSMNVNIESRQNINEVPKSLEEIDRRIAELEGRSIEVKALAASHATASTEIDVTND